MENQEVLRSKPLSYEASKAVLKSLSLGTREAINRRIPALRTINSRLPYVLENVDIGDNYFGTNGIRWTIRSAGEPKFPLNKVVRHRESTVITRQDNALKSVQYRVHKSQREVYKQLFDEYIKDGTVVRGSLFLYEVPEFFKEIRENESDFKIRATKMVLETETEDYENFIRFIDLDVLENVRFYDVKNSLALLDKSEIKSCKKLTIIAEPLDFLSVDQLLRLRNEHLQLQDYRCTSHGLQLLVQDWITTGREIGTRLSWEKLQFEFVVSCLEYLKTHFGGVETMSNHGYCFSDKVLHGNGITLKMGDDRVLVMFCAEIPSERHTYCQWTFEMEVIACTSATANP